MSNLRKPLGDVTIPPLPPVAFDITGKVETKIIQPGEVYTVTGLFSFVNLSGTNLVYSVDTIDPHPELWDDPRWTGKTSVTLLNQGETSGDVGGERIFTTGLVMNLTAGGYLPVKVTLRGVAL